MHGQVYQACVRRWRMGCWKKRHALKTSQGSRRLSDSNESVVATDWRTDVWRLVCGQPPPPHPFTRCKVILSDLSSLFCCVPKIDTNSVVPISGSLNSQITQAKRCNSRSTLIWGKSTDEWWRMHARFYGLYWYICVTCNLILLYSNFQRNYTVTPYRRLDASSSFCSASASFNLFANSDTFILSSFLRG